MKLTNIEKLMSEFDYNLGADEKRQMMTNRVKRNICQLKNDIKINKQCDDQFKNERLNKN